MSAAALEAEEGDQPLGHLPSSGDHTVLALLKEWVFGAALRAPTRTEALLHLFLTQVGAVDNGVVNLMRVNSSMHVFPTQVGAVG